jgi:putative endonuclease
MSHVYIIKSTEGLVYVDSTTDLDKRLYQHKNKLAGWTKRGNGWKLIYSEEFENCSEARERQLWFKTGKGREYIKENILSGLQGLQSAAADCRFSLKELLPLAISKA